MPTGKEWGGEHVCLPSGEQMDPDAWAPGWVEFLSPVALSFLLPGLAHAAPSDPYTVLLPHKLLLILLISEKMQLPWGIYFPSRLGPLW